MKSLKFYSEFLCEFTGSKSTPNVIDCLDISSEIGLLFFISGSSTFGMALI